MRERGDAAQSTQKIERDALAGEDRARRAFDLGEERRHVGDGRSVLDERLDANGWVDGAEHRGGDRDAAHDAGLLEQELRTAARVRGDERCGRPVSCADVFSQRRGDDAVDLGVRQLHRSSSGSPPGWMTR